jgi:hypothetical protein
VAHQNPPEPKQKHGTLAELQDSRTPESLSLKAPKPQISSSWPLKLWALVFEVLGLWGSERSSVLPDFIECQVILSETWVLRQWLVQMIDLLVKLGPLKRPVKAAWAFNDALEGFLNATCAFKKGILTAL